MARTAFIILSLLVAAPGARALKTRIRVSRRVLKNARNSRTLNRLAKKWISAELQVGRGSELPEEARLGAGASS